jgi:hypothetical protein
MATNHHKYIFDAATEMKDAGLVASSAAAQVDAADKILDFGGAVMTEGDLVIDITAIEVASGDEKYEIEWQLSSSATFASAVNTASVIKVGDSSVTGSSADTGVGRYVRGVSNEFGGTVFRYARLYTRIAGTIATGINYTAFLTKR